jgi:hypothetical protein
MDRGDDGVGMDVVVMHDRDEVARILPSRMSHAVLLTGLAMGLVIAPQNRIDTGLIAFAL